MRLPNHRLIRTLDQRLKKHKLFSSERIRSSEIHLLLHQLFELTQSELLLKPESPVDAKKLFLFDEYVRRRLKGEVPQYILGRTYFYDSYFKVGPGVFIPRPETELLVEILRPFLSGAAVELGSGAGVLGISLVKHCKNLHWESYEKNKIAYEYTCLNKDLLLSRSDQLRLQVHLEDFFCAKGRKFDWLIANPPYIPNQRKLTQSVLQEPHLALFGGDHEGVYLIKRLILQSPFFLKKGGQMILEIDSTHSKAVARLAQPYFQDIRVVKDDSNKDRFIWLKQLKFEHV